MRFPGRWAIATLGAIHLAAFVWLASDPARRRAMFFHSASVSSATIALPPERLIALGYVQDDSRQLARFLPMAQEAVDGAESDLDRVQRLSDAIYALRRSGVPPLGAFDALTLTDVANAMESGAAAQCGHRTWMLTGLARSLGIDIRQIVWAKNDGTVGHASLEFYARDEQRWIYFDLNLNGYATADGRALSAAELRARTAGASNTRLVSNAQMRTWDEAAFRRVYDTHDFDWHVMSNELRPFERGTRFGRMHAAYGLLTSLPPGAQRIADYFLTGRQTRLGIAGHVPESLLPAPALRGLAVYLLAGAAVLLVACAVGVRRRREVLESPKPIAIPAA